MLAGAGLECKARSTPCHAGRVSKPVQAHAPFEARDGVLATISLATFGERRTHDRAPFSAICLAGALLGPRLGTTWRRPRVLSFAYDHVNEPIPPAEFSPPLVEGLPPTELEPLPEGCDRHFLTLRDGAGGNVGLRWGQRGAKKVMSSGLN